MIQTNSSAGRAISVLYKAYMYNVHVGRYKQWASQSKLIAITANDPVIASLD